MINITHSARITLILMGILTACSGGSNGGESSNAQEESNTGENSDTTIIGNNFTIGSNQYSLEYIDHTITVPLSGLNDGEIFYSLQEANFGEYASISLDSEFVNALGVLSNDEDIFTFGIQGDAPNSSSVGVSGYSGSYSKILYEGGSYQHILQDISLSVDFNSGTISGSAAENENGQFANFYGEFGEDGVSLSITDQNGVYIADGNFFGENSEAFAAGFAQENIVGIVEAEH